MASEWQIYAIFDEVEAEFLLMYPANNNVAAIRVFGDMLRDPQSRLNRHAADYHLKRIARWRRDTGVLYAVDVLEDIASGADMFTPTLVPGAEPSGEIKAAMEAGK